MKVTTIARNPKNSPNMTANDAAILKCISDELAAMGVEVTRIEECEEVDDDTDIVCHMTRTASTLEMLKSSKGATSSALASAQFIVLSSESRCAITSMISATTALAVGSLPAPGP